MIRNLDRTKRPSPYDVVARDLAAVLRQHGYTNLLGNPLDVIKFKRTWIIGDGHGDPANILRDLEIDLPGLPDSLARMLKRKDGD